MKKLITVTYYDEQGKVIAQVIRETYKEQKKKEKDYKKFLFILLDKNDNIIVQYERKCRDKRHSLELAKFIMQNTLRGNLHQIKTIEL